MLYNILYQFLVYNGPRTGLIEHKKVAQSSILFGKLSESLGNEIPVSSRGFLAKYIRENFWNVKFHSRMIRKNSNDSEENLIL